MTWIKKVAETPLASIAKVIDSLQQTPNERRNAPSIRAVREGIQQAASTAMYPVGSVYMSIYDVDPHELFGGTWTRIKDKFILSSGDAYANGSTGGVAEIEYTPSGAVGGHSLSVPELPKHIHLYYPYYPTDSGVSADFYHVASGSDIDIPKIKQNGSDYSDWTKDNFLINGTANPGKTEFAAGEAHTHDFAGTQTTFDNMPPYFTVNMWYRTA